MGHAEGRDGDGGAHVGHDVGLLQERRHGGAVGEDSGHSAHELRHEQVVAVRGQHHMEVVVRALEHDGRRDCAAHGANGHVYGELVVVGMHDLGRRVAAVAYPGSGHQLRHLLFLAQHLPRD